MKATITFWFDPEKKLSAAQLTVKGTEHESADIRRNTIVVSKSTLRSSMKYSMCDDKLLECGYTKLTISIPCKMFPDDRTSYTYVECDLEKFSELINIETHQKKHNG